MKKFIFCYLVCLLLCATNLKAQTADEIVDAHFELTGGKTAWKGVEGVFMEGKVKMQGLEFPMSMKMKRPNMVKTEISFNGKKIINAFDGEVGWTVNPMAMTMEPTKMTDQELSQFDGQHIEDDLLHYSDKGHEIAYEGTETIEGTECHKVKLTKKDGSIEFHFFDVETNIKIMQRAFAKEGPTKGQPVDTYFSDYDEVDGLYSIPL